MVNNERPIPDPSQPEANDQHERGVLFGRDDELAAIAALVGQARSGRGHLILVSGEAGIGKTALVRALSWKAEEHGFQLLHGHCYDLSQTPPFGPWHDALERVVPATTPPGVARVRGRSNTSGWVEAQLRDLLSAGPVLCILEDLHWSDDASLMLLRRMSHRIENRPVLIVVTYRDDELHRDSLLFRLLPRLVREAPSTRFELRRLEPYDLADLIQARYQLPLDDQGRLVDLLVRYTDGIPLFIEELLRTLERDGRLIDESGVWSFVDVPDTQSSLPVPALLRQILEDRLIALDAPARDSLRVAAVIGEEISFDIWSSVLGAEHDDPAKIVERVLEHGILEGAESGERLRFRHALVREALYRELSPPRRRDWHRRIADTMLERSTPDPDAVSYHLQQAGDPRAATWLIQAAEHALRSYAPIAATARLRAAVELLEASGDRTNDLGWYLLRLGSMARESFALDVTDGYLNRALEIARTTNDRLLELNVIWARGTNRCYQGVNGLGFMRQALDLHRDLDAGARPREPLRLIQGEVVAAGVLATWSALFGDVEGSLAAADEQLAGESLDTFQQRFGAAFAHGGLAYSFAMLGRPEEARREFGALQEIFGSIQHRWAQAIHYFGELAVVAVPYFTDDLHYRQWLADRIEPRWRDHVAAATLLAPRYGLIPSLLIEGHWAEIRDLTSHLSRLSVYELYGLYALGVVARFQGDPELAWRQVQLVIPEGASAPAGGVVRLESLLLIQLAVELAIDGGDLDLARSWLAAHDRWFVDASDDGPPRFGQSENHLLHACLLDHSGDRDGARARASLALKTASAPRQPLAMLRAHRILGDLASHADDAREHFEESARLAAACACPHELALTWMAQAHLAFEAGQPAQARSLLEQAGEIFDRMDLALLEPEFARLEQRVADTTTRLPGVVPLTSREREVLRLIVRGASNREIAAELSLSVRTVERHISNIYNKTSIHGRAAITAYALRHQII